MLSGIAVTLFASAAMVAGHGTIDKLIVDGKAYPGAKNWAAPENKNSPVRQFPLDTGYVDYRTVTSSMDIACGKEGYKGTPVVAPIQAGGQIKVRWDGDQGKDGNQWPHCEGTHVAYMAPCTNGDCKTFNPSDALWFKIHEAGLDPNLPPRQCPDGHLAWPHKGRWAQNLAFEDDSWFTVNIPKTIKAGQYLLRHELVSMHSAHQREGNGGAQYYPACIQLDVKGTGTAQPQGVPATKIYTIEDGILDIYKETAFNYKVPGPALFKDDASAPAPPPAPAPPKPPVTTTKPASTKPIQSTTVVSSTVYAPPPPKPTSKTCKPKRGKRDLHEETQYLYKRALVGAQARHDHGAARVKRSF